MAAHPHPSRLVRCLSLARSIYKLRGLGDDGEAPADLGRCERCSAHLSATADSCGRLTFVYPIPVRSAELPRESVASGAAGAVRGRLRGNKKKIARLLPQLSVEVIVVVLVRRYYIDMWEKGEFLLDITYGSPSAAFMDLQGPRLRERVVGTRR